MVIHQMRVKPQEQKTRRMIGLAERLEGLYHLVVGTKDAIASSTQAARSQILPQEALWHFRIGNLSKTRLLTVHEQFPFVNIDENSICDVCHYARRKKLTFSLSPSRASRPYELLHFDIWGPISTFSIHGHRYFLTALDDYSQFTWVILMKSKADARNHVQNLILMIENQYDTSVKTVRTDNGPEFSMTQFYASKGIIHQTSCVESPQQNGRVERKHQHVLNVGRALLY